MPDSFLVFLGILMIAVAVLGYKYVSLKSHVAIRVQEKSLAWQREAENELQRQLQMRLKEWRDKEIQTIKSVAQREAIENAQKLYQSWCEREIENIRRDQKNVANEEANNKLLQWKTEQEEGIRRDAILRSQAVTLGKVTEHLIPFLPEFIYNPKDARFVSSPIDFIIFDGLNEEDNIIREIVFVEIKTGTSTLSKKQRKVKDAIQGRRVRWEEMRVNREVQPITGKLFQ